MTSSQLNNSGKHSCYLQVTNHQRKPKEKSVTCHQVIIQLVILLIGEHSSLWGRGDKLYKFAFFKAMLFSRMNLQISLVSRPLILVVFKRLQKSK